MRIFFLLRKDLLFPAYLPGAIPFWCRFYTLVYVQSLVLYMDQFPSVSLAS